MRRLIDCGIIILSISFVVTLPPPSVSEDCKQLLNKCYRPDKDASTPCKAGCKCVYEGKHCEENNYSVEDRRKRNTNIDDYCDDECSGRTR